MTKPKTVFRTDGKNRSYTNIANTLLQDQTIGWDVRGMLCDLLSRPSNWEISAAGLIAMTRVDGKPSVGKALVWRLIKDALSAGYMAKTVERRKDGTIAAFIYIVSDDPAFLREQADCDPHTENRGIETACQHTENQCTAEPCIDNPPQQTIEKNKLSKKKTKNLMSEIDNSGPCKKYASELSRTATAEEDVQRFAIAMKKLDENACLAPVLFKSSAYAELGAMMDNFGARAVEEAISEIVLRQKTDGKVRRGGIRSWRYFAKEAASVAAKRAAAEAGVQIEDLPW